MRNIIVGLDLSKYSRNVASQARILAAQTKAKITWVHVFQDVEVLSKSIALSRIEIEKQTCKQIQKIYKIPKEQKVLIRFGSPSVELLKVARALPKSILFVGHQGHNALMRMFLGTTAERLALESKVPVWIQRGTRLKKTKKVLVPCDLTSRSTQTLAFVNQLKWVNSRDVELYHVLVEPLPTLDFEGWSILYSEVKKQDDKKVILFRRKYPQLKVDRSFGDAGMQILKRSKSFDLVAMSPRSRHLSSFGSVTAKVVRSTNVPILIVP